jgi:hypothetical protein
MGRQHKTIQSKELKERQKVFFMLKQPFHPLLWIIFFVYGIVYARA